MVNEKIIPLTPHFRIRVLPEARGFTLSDFDKIHIDGIWRKEEDRIATKLFNGKILNFVEWEGETLVGEFVDYKFYLAQFRDPALRDLLNIEPIGASGITLSGDKILFGKRASFVTNYPGWYELVPSGNVDDGALVDGYIDLKKQFEVELWEETGISVTEVRSIEPKALIYDSHLRNYELCAIIKVNYGVVREDIHSSDEYEELRWISQSTISSFLKQQKESLVPITVDLLQLFKILPGAGR